MFQIIRNKLLGTTPRKIRRNSARFSRPLRFEGLEVRQMMTATLGTPDLLLDEALLSGGKAPAAPALTATAVSPSQINLKWNSVSGANGYLVDEWINSAWKQIASFGSSTTGCGVGGSSANTTYFFDVAAYNSAGTTWANWQSATTKLAAPAAASFTATAVSALQVDLAWKSVNGASSYLVDEWINNAWSQIASLGSSASGYAVSGLSANTTYYFEVAASNSAGTTWANWQTPPPRQAHRPPRCSRPRRSPHRRSTWRGTA